MTHALAKTILKTWSLLRVSYKQSLSLIENGVTQNCESENSVQKILSIRCVTHIHRAVEIHRL